MMLCVSGENSLYCSELNAFLYIFLGLGLGFSRMSLVGVVWNCYIFFLYVGNFMTVSCMSQCMIGGQTLFWSLLKFDDLEKTFEYLIWGLSKPNFEYIQYSKAKIFDETIGRRSLKYY